MVKSCRAGQTTDDNIAHAHCMLDNWSCKHTFAICNNYCFSAARTVAQERLNVTSYYVASPVILRIVNYVLCTKFCMTYNFFDIKEGRSENDFTNYVCGLHKKKSQLILLLSYNNPTSCSCAHSILFHCSVSLHVSGAFHTHHQEYINCVFTASDTGHTSVQLPFSNVAEFELVSSCIT